MQTDFWFIFHQTVNYTYSRSIFENNTMRVRVWHVCMFGNFESTALQEYTTPWWAFMCMWQGFKTKPHRIVETVAIIQDLHRSWPSFKTSTDHVFTVCNTHIFTAFQNYLCQKLTSKLSYRKNERHCMFPLSTMWYNKTLDIFSELAHAAMEAPWRLFLNNLLFTATKQQVQEVLEEYGVGYGVEYIHIPRKGSVIDGVKHTIAFITYEQKEQVEAAVLALHDKILDPISTYPVAAMHARSRTSGKAYPHQVWQPWPSPKGNNAGAHSGGDEKANDGGETKETKGEESKEEKQQQDTAFAQPVFAQPAGPPQPIWTHQPCPVHGQHFLPVDAWGASPVHLGCPVQYHPVGVIPAPWRQSPNPGTTSKAAAVARERVVLRAKPKPSSISSSEEEKKKKKGCGTRKLKKHLPHQTQALRMQQKIHMGGDLQKNCEKHWEQKLWKRGHSQNLLPAANHLPRRKQSHWRRMKTRRKRDLLSLKRTARAKDPLRGEPDPEEGPDPNPGAATEEEPDPVRAGAATEEGPDPVRPGAIAEEGQEAHRPEKGQEAHQVVVAEGDSFTSLTRDSTLAECIPGKKAGTVSAHGMFTESGIWHMNRSCFFPRHFETWQYSIDDVHRLYSISMSVTLREMGTMRATDWERFREDVLKGCVPVCLCVGLRYLSPKRILFQVRPDNNKVKHRLQSYYIHY